MSTKAKYGTTTKNASTEKWEKSQLIHDTTVDVKGGFQDKLHINDPAQNPHLGNALNDPTPGKRVHSMTPSLKKISPSS